MLSSINLPGGAQRKRTEEDERMMREFYEEGDLICAEVQSLYKDGTVILHARDLQYGKLENGQLVQVPASLIKRLKKHFITLPEPCSTDLIIGRNGQIWITYDFFPEYVFGIHICV
jgi:exosome complex component RRP4